MQNKIESGSLISGKTAAERVKFSFGENWLEYVNSDLSETRVDIAIRSIQDFAGITDLKGKVFLDIGCGSGLYSLAAWRLGAERIVSVDLDSASVRATELVRSSAGSPANWLVLQGNIIDEALQDEIGEADFVYCWGVLHHTGEMYRAIRYTCRLVARKGILYLALYNHCRSAHWWLRIKRLYNRLPEPLQLAMVAGYGSASILNKIRRGENPVAFLREYSLNSRGMSFRRDLVDWLGGLPYEFAKPEQIFDFVAGFGFELGNVKTVVTHGCNEFLFRRPA
jgi:2-polyprenyl-3-methyl-5-hydroxy-6-metoxy-1,4-benzoquinol methylase